MKTTIASILVVSSLFAGAAHAGAEKSLDVLEASLEQSIQQDILQTRNQVKNENQLQLAQLIAEFKFALSPSTLVATVSDAAIELLTGNEE